MNKYFLQVKAWLSKRTERELTYLFICGFAVIYLFYFLIFLRPTLIKKQLLLKDHATLLAKKDIIIRESLNLQNLTKNPAYIQMTNKQKDLTQQISKIKQQITNFKPVYFSPAELSSLRTNILNEQKNVGMISLKEFPSEPWPPKDETNKTNLLNSLKGIYQNQVGIKFRNQYFPTLYYLQRLEKLSTNVYWDSMEYKGLEYPNAEIDVTFHVLSTQKS